MTPVVSHVLSIAITTLLIISLVATATGFLEGQQDDAARSEIETIGNRLASELAAVDRLATYGDETSVRTVLPKTVAGSTYTVTLQNGTCGGVSTPTCLHLQTAEYQLSAVVPVQNETELHIESRTGGVFVVTSNGSDGTPTPERRDVELSPRIGIGSDVGARAGLEPGNSFSQQPVAKFRFEPDPPDVSDTIDFDAGSSFDPDGSIDTYEWDWNSDGSINYTDTNPTASHPFGSPGSHNVTLRVTDGSGMSANMTRTIDVSGLEYNHDMSEVAPSESDRLNLTVTNEYPGSITIERVLIDPVDPGYDYLDGAYEVEIDVGPDGSVNGYADWSGGTDIPEDGRIANLDSQAVLSSGQTAELTLKEFNHDPIQNKDFTVGLRYRIDATGEVGANVVTDTVPP